MPNGSQPHNPPPSNSGGDDITKIGALSDGFANTATNSTEIDDGSNGYIGTANGNDRGNWNDNSTDGSYNDNSQTSNATTNTTNNTDNSDSSDHSVDVDVDAKIALGNGDNRDNSYNWDYTSKTVNVTDNDNINKTEDSFNSKIEDSYNAKTESKIEDSYNTKTEDKVEDSYNTKVEDSNNSKIEDSYNSKIEDSYNSDNDFADLDKVLNTGNLGIAGGDLTFNLGDDFSFNMDVGNVLGGNISGSGFSTVQANHLADQDTAYNLSMDNSGANNYLSANGGMAHGAEGIDTGHAWTDVPAASAGDDVTGTSTADASAILANSGFHMELVQGANMLSNTVDSTIAGGDVSHVGGDSAG